MNSEFLGSVFTESQRSIILETEIENKASPETSLNGGSGSNTEDKIFLLSYGEAALYFPSNSARTAVYNAAETQYSALAQALDAKSNNEDWVYKLTYTEAFISLRTYVYYTDWWWLRATETYPYTGSARVAYVNYDGSLERHNEIFEPLGGLRPAMWMNTKPSAIGNVSAWAKPEIEKADALGLIPDSFLGQDLTKPITRAEFAAVSVKVYEALSGTTAIPAVTNPFTDTQDVDVLKAYNIGITTGTSATTFDLTPCLIVNKQRLC